MVGQTRPVHQIVILAQVFFDRAGSLVSSRMYRRVLGITLVFGYR